MSMFKKNNQDIKESVVKESNDYSKLITDKEKINFVAKKLGLIK